MAETVRIKFTTDNAAFEGNPNAEAARILRDLADRLERREWESGGFMTCRDVNGNTVGHLTID